MERYDIFICYRGKSAASCELGSRIHNRISATSNYKAFFAPECINKGSDYKQAVTDVIHEASVFVMLVDTNFFDGCINSDDIVKHELKEALKNDNMEFLPIFLSGASFEHLDEYGFLTEDEIMRIKHLNGLDYSGIYNFSIENDLIPAIDRIVNSGNKIEEMSKRDKSRYYDTSNTDESAFLDVQHNFLYNYDTDVYAKMLDGKRELNVLDVGCNDGKQTMNRFGKDERVKRIMGIDRDETVINLAKSNYPDATFEVVDIEKPDFYANMQKLTQAAGIDKFDIITISMVILHLEYPYKLLLQIKKLLKCGGQLFIRDIDDGLNFAYPDEDGIFRRLTDICKYCDMLGFRQSGRQIYSYLKNADYTDISLEKIGLNTSRMSFEEKETLFEIYFGYIPTALERTLDRKPTLRAQIDYNWAVNIMEKAREQFLKGDFIFSLGYFIYTAKTR